MRLTSISFLFPVFLFLGVVACGDPYERVEKELSNQNPAGYHSLNVHSFTVCESNENGARNLVKMGLDFHTKKNMLGVFAVIHHELRDTVLIRQISSLSLDSYARINTKQDTVYEGNQVLSMVMREPKRRANDQKQFLLLSRGKNEESYASRGSIKLAEPNLYPYGIQEYERQSIPDDEIIFLFSARESAGKKVTADTWKDVGYTANFVVMFYEDALEKNVNQMLSSRMLQQRVLQHDQNYLVIGDPESYTGNIEDSDYQGFAFGVDGDRKYPNKN